MCRQFDAHPKRDQQYSSTILYRMCLEREQSRDATGIASLTKLHPDAE